MKKIIIATALFLATVNICTAQAFTKGTNLASAAIGIGSSIGSFSNSSQAPAFSVQYERGIAEAGNNGIIGVGGYLGVKSYKYSGKSGTYEYSQKWNYTVVGVKGAYHYQLSNDKVDVYGGVMLSYNILRYKFEDNDNYTENDYSRSYGSAVGFTGYVGGRYYFAEKAAAFAELGYGVIYLSLGVTLKF